MEYIGFLVVIAAAFGFWGCGVWHHRREWRLLGILFLFAAAILHGVGTTMLAFSVVGAGLMMMGCIALGLGLATPRAKRKPNHSHHYTGGLLLLLFGAFFLMII